MRSTAALLAWCSLSAIASAQVNSTGIFTGTHSEGFETGDDGACVVPNVFNGAGTLCSPNGSMNVSGAWSFMCLIQEHSGSNFVASTSGYAEYSFPDPVQRFGGWFGTNGSPGVVTVRFYDAGGTLIATETPNVPADCSWTWHGWQATTVPIGSVQVDNSVHNGCHVMMDDMQIDLNSGFTSFCTSTVNSSGNAAQIAGLGSSSISANDLVLSSMGMPVMQPGIFYYGPAEVQVPFGDGFRCVGTSGPGTIFRLFPFILSSATGDAQFSVDNANLPPGGQFAPGSTWKFQSWFRDPDAQMSGFNLSDGLSVTFTP